MGREKLAATGKLTVAALSLAFAFTLAYFLRAQYVVCRRVEQRQIPSYGREMARTMPDSKKKVLFMLVLFHVWFFLRIQQQF